MSIDINAFYWAAGFLDGDGSFTVSNGSPYISAYQLNQEPLCHLIHIFGGNIYWSGSLWRWQCGGGKAAGIAMTLYSLLGEKNKKRIAVILAQWRKRPGNKKWRRSCQNGHEFTSANSYMWKGSRLCRTCRKMAHLRSSEKKCHLAM